MSINSLDVQTAVSEWLEIHRKLMSYYFLRRPADLGRVTVRTLQADKDESRLRALTRILAVAAEGWGIDSSPYHLLLGNMTLDPALLPTNSQWDQTHALTKRLEAAASGDTGAFTSAAVAEPETPEPRYLFRLKQQGGVYEVRFGKEEGTIPADLLGAKFAHEMIQHPNRQYPAIELRQGVGGIDDNHRETSRDSGEADRRMATDSLDKCREALKEIDAEISDAKAMGSEGRQERAERQKIDILQEIRRLSGRSQPGRQISSGDKHRVAVATAIKTLREHCHEKGLVQFAAHLDMIDAGTSCAYRPQAPAPDWHF